MVQQIASKADQHFDWIDITDPDSTELMQVADRYGLHPALVNDCLQPDHLPKYERIDRYSFIIFRIHTDSDVPEADTPQEITDKIAIFYAEDFIITVHRKKRMLIEHQAELVQSQRCKSTQELLNTLIYDCLSTFEAPLTALSKDLDYYEETVFLHPRKALQLKGLYYIRRRVDLVRRILILSAEIVEFLDAETGNVDTRETRDEYVKLQHMFSALSENINQLLNVYFSASSQRTNEIIRILTIFSVFFMPLTFIAGIYGMNFDFMPELRLKMGYPAVLVVMAIVTLIIYIWFKRKRWL